MAIHHGRHFWWTLIPALVLAASLYGIFFLSNPIEPDPQNPRLRADEVIVVRPNASMHEIADTLAKRGMLRSELTFRVAAKMLRMGHNVHGGTFKIQTGLSNTQLLKRITGTDYQIIYQFTTLEGMTLRHVTGIISSSLGIPEAQIIRAANDVRYLHWLGLPAEATNAEGFLYPDTYKWLYPVDARQIITEMISHFKKIVPDTLLESGIRHGFSPYQILTIASIVDGETKLDEERYIIAGVYENRLHIGMKMQADPTVQYGLQLDRPIGHADLFKPSPYNTYLNKGLPPGPINNPNLACIRAAVWPAHHDYLFFVARRDGSNGHFFSHSFAQQNANINKERHNIRRG